ncbi:cytidylyltransferase domain-containing protein [Pedobacter foliorum]|uniref:cytidylyltransferase domain-containing protein n=1 Tax=Pedobacter foliorum TaxID=2739058 RepID=UPI001564A93F|nr:spore coat protein [Pedobacter foliorum]NRF39190.1 spore coat protein [Pedobacter foliorum]
MVAGQQNKYKIAFIIQARMRSTRLPNKVLMPIPLGSNRPILKWITDELNRSSFNGKVIIATSTNIENNVLESYCIDNDISCFRGDEDDVLSRFIEITESEKIDIIVRLTADNPILDSSILDRIITYHIDNNNDYTKTIGLPTGMNLEVVSSSSLLSLKEKELSNQDKEHVTLFIRNSGLYKTGDFMPSSNAALHRMRLTIDYPSDYMVASSVLSKIESSNKEESRLTIIEEIYKTDAWIFEVNQTNFQKQQPANLNDEIQIACNLLDDYDLKRASQILKDHK